jgi:hypothetical protein
MKNPIHYLFFVCFASSAYADELEWKSVDAWQTWFTFRVPASFVEDPQSFKGEGHKWVVILNQPNSKFSVAGSPYGYISQIDGESRGFKSARDLFLADEVKIGAKILNKGGYEIFIQHKESYTQAYFLPANPDWGMCYRSLFFEYPKGQRHDYDDLINKMVDSFTPFPNKRPNKAEQATPRKPSD